MRSPSFETRARARSSSDNGEAVTQGWANYGWQRGKPPHALAHIRFLFSGLVAIRQLSFFGHSPDSIIPAPELALDPAAIRRSRQAGQRSIAVA
jgi:hypothetical protein